MNIHDEVTYHCIHCYEKETEEGGDGEAVWSKHSGEEDGDDEEEKDKDQHEDGKDDKDQDGDEDEKKDKYQDEDLGWWRLMLEEEGRKCKGGRSNKSIFVQPGE